MGNFKIWLDQLPEPNPDGIVQLGMSLEEVVFTQVLRGNVTDTSLRVPVAPLAFWFAENWWRLRWETKPGLDPDFWPEDWLMAHKMASIGEGHAWPNLTIWGGDKSINFASRSDPVGIGGPVCFLTNALTHTSADQFETEVQAFLQKALELTPAGDLQVDLDDFLRVLSQERADPAIAQWRRLEAMSGFNPDKAPESMIERLCDLEREFGKENVSDAVAGAPGAEAASVLDAALAEVSQAPIANFSAAASEVSLGSISAGSPWEMGESAARLVRELNHIASDLPIRNNLLLNLCQVPKRTLERRDRCETRLPYAICKGRDDGSSHVLLNARYPQDRRFQLARALGDAVWTNDARMATLSNAITERQQYQRSFAASLLCPEMGLRDFLHGSSNSDEDIAAASRHFHVNEKTVRTVMVNKGMIHRHRLGLSQYEDTGREGAVEVAA